MKIRYAVEKDVYGSCEPTEYRIFDASKARERIESETYWDGSNWCAVHGGQFRQEILYHTAAGKYVIVDLSYGPSGSSWMGSQDCAYMISEDEAAQWLIANGNLDHPLAAIYTD